MNKVVVDAENCFPFLVFCFVLKEKQEPRREYMYIYIYIACFILGVIRASLENISLKLESNTWGKFERHFCEIGV